MSKVGFSLSWNICHMRGVSSQRSTNSALTDIRPAGYERCDPCAKVYCWSYGVWWPLPTRLSYTLMALYSATVSKGNPHLWPRSTFYSAYSARAAVTHQEMDDIMQDVIEGMMQSGDGHMYGDYAKVDVSLP